MTPEVLIFNKTIKDCNTFKSDRLNRRDMILFKKAMEE